ncbi:MAG: YicC family protein [Synergistaceae bacterium]|nr:YicC family protein [Synergistaceae bacterium]MBR0168153.1 YicC family protein [Synergistaceae bacterium]
MFISMTGYGSKSYSFTWGTVKFEVNSVNHKYQDFTVRLPRELMSLENRVLNILRTNIARGKVKLSAEITWNPGAKVPVIDNDSVRVLIGQVRTLAKRNGLEAPDDITSFLMLPGVLDANDNAAEEAALENPEIWDKITLEAIDALNETKRIEGGKLREKVAADLSILEGIVETLKERWKIARDDAIEGLRIRIENVMEHYDLEFDEARIAQEVALLSDRWDVSEEVARLEAHTGRFRQIMDEDSCGKKLDFLIQEMNREINTMGSKVNDSEFRWGIVEAKSCIERMREQIQNIE